MNIYGCGSCGGLFKVDTVRTSGLRRIRFLRCQQCDARTTHTTQLASDGSEPALIILNRPANSTNHMDGNRCTHKL